MLKISCTAKYLAIAAIIFVPAHADAKAISIIIDHESGATSYSEVLQVAKGDTVRIAVQNTNKGCYSYNLRQLTTPIDGTRAILDGTQNPDTVEFVDVHNGRTTQYEIKVNKRSDAPDSCRNPPIDKSFEFIVDGWNLSFTGAATLDELTSPVLFLEPGSMTGTGGQPVDGYFVRRNVGAEDDRSIGFAVMGHLYHTERLQIWKSGQLQWAPISFGFGVAENSSTQLYLGTSLKFGDRFFLTAGRVWGDVDRLPANLEEGDFTEDPNAISTLGSKNDSDVFVSFSYLFGEIDLSKFSTPFSTKKPDPN